jgi:hypothetical protein
LDWTFRITDTSDTTLITKGPWGIARFGNILYGNQDRTHVNLGVSCTTGTSGQNYQYCTVGGGYANNASGRQATVSGGRDNIATEEGATVSGGWGNRATAEDATIGGGYDNQVSVAVGTISGGDYNGCGGDSGATIGGGMWGEAWGKFSTIPGGWMNKTDADYSLAAGRWTRLTEDADYTFAFGNNFSTSASHAVIFCDTDTPIKVGVQVTAPTEALDVNGTARLRSMGSSTGTDVVVDANGKLWKKSSSLRYKQNVRKLESTPEQLLQLQPMRFQWKSTGEEDIGLIAEEVEKTIPDLVIHDNQGRPDAVKYDKITVYLLELVKSQQDQVDVQQKQIEALKAKLEKLESAH